MLIGGSEFGGSLSRKKMTLDEFIKSDKVAPPEISQVFAGEGLIRQFENEKALGTNRIVVSYFRPMVYLGKAYHEIYHLLLDRYGNIIDNSKDSTFRGWHDG